MKLEIQDGCFSYPKAKAPTLTNVNFCLEQGEILTILGRNGIGKTTLIKCIGGVLHWSSGHVLVDGQAMPSVHQIKSIAFVPQARAASYGYSVFDMVLMGRVRHMGLLSIPSWRDREITARILTQMGLDAFAERSCNQLSGGQLQMVLIARALAAEPEVLVMDEPESHLDFKNQYFILELIQRLVREHNLSCIINTHYPDHALQISDKTLLLGDNRSEFGKTAELLSEDKIQQYFDVRVKIAEAEDQGRRYKSFVVVGE